MKGSLHGGNRTEVEGAGAAGGCAGMSGSVGRRCAHSSRGAGCTESGGGGGGGGEAAAPGNTGGGGGGGGEAAPAKAGGGGGGGGGEAIEALGPAAPAPSAAAE